MGPWVVIEHDRKDGPTFEAIVHVDRVGPWFGVQMRLDHGLGGWAHGLWCSTAYMLSHYYLVLYKVVLLFDHPSIFNILYMLSCYYVVLFPCCPVI